MLSRKRASARQVTRATAERLLKDVIDRARHFNAVPGHVIEVAELIVFGSYLDPTKDRLGNLDLAVKFRDLLPEATPDQRMKKPLALFARQRTAVQEAQARVYGLSA